MMHMGKRLVTALVALVALSSVGAASASAAQFTFSAIGSLEGHALESTKFTTNAGTMECSTAASKGETKATSSLEFGLTTNLSGCKSFGIVNVDNTPIPLQLTSSGVVHMTSTFIQTVTGGIFGNCTVTFPVQTLNSFTYANAGTNNIIVTLVGTGVSYTGSGGLCGSGTFTNGTLVGKWEINRIGGGSIRFDP